MYLFVYGTLKKNKSNHNLLKNAEFIGEAFVFGTLYDLNVGFPALVETGNNKVYGEIYKIDDSLIESLDQFEGFHNDDIDNSLYIRKSINVNHNNKLLECQVYVMTESSLKKFIYTPINSGKW